MDTQNIKKLIGEDCPQVNNYIAYLLETKNKKKKQNGQYVIANPWMAQRTDDYLARVYKAVAEDHLIFDGIDVTLQSTGVSYSYQAYKNRMFYTYPESIIDVGLVYKDDVFNFKKESGKVSYNHKISNPFAQTNDNIIGAYCVIKNKRGEFLTLLTREDIDKHRRVAKTDYIWKAWFAEMSMKTIIKKACKTHFKDSFTTIETLDNENYDLEKLNAYIDEKHVAKLQDIIDGKGIDVKKLCEHFDIESIKKILVEDFTTILTALQEK